jgi:hypothetical protein
MSTDGHSGEIYGDGSTGPAGRINPAALTVGQLARMLSLSEEKVRAHVAAGAPAAADGTLNLVHYSAWLNQRLKEHNGD